MVDARRIDPAGVFFSFGLGRDTSRRVKTDCRWIFPRASEGMGRCKTPGVTEPSPDELGLLQET